MTVVIANIRGGGEFGEEWHHEGILHKKMNGFLDFRHAAKYLIAEGYTTSDKLAINGGSNGGLLAAACALQEPELFACSIADVGVLDMLRFHKFTIGYAWKSDYGDPDKEEDFNYLIKYSPLHNVDPSKKYPYVLLTTSDHDDRVVPLHSYKMIAQWQYAAANNPNPIVIRIETNAGHGAGKSTQKRIEEAVDKFSFMAKALNLVI
jgi:prolyl oligopeptidase